MTVTFLRKLEDAIETHIKMLYRIRCIKVEKDKGPKSGNETDKDDSDSGEVMMTRARIQRLMILVQMHRNERSKQQMSTIMRKVVTMRRMNHLQLVDG